MHGYYMSTTQLKCLFKSPSTTGYILHLTAASLYENPTLDFCRRSSFVTSPIESRWGQTSCSAIVTNYLLLVDVCKRDRLLIAIKSSERGCCKLTLAPSPQHQTHRQTSHSPRLWLIAQKQMQQQL